MLGYLSYYRSLGFALIPCYPRSKVPSVKWKKFYEKGYTDDDFFSFLDFWKRDEPYNVAVMTGINGIVGIDFDTYDVYAKIFNPEKIERETLVVATPRGGRHVYFKSAEHVRTFKFMNLKLEVHGSGSILILPPSIHPSGRRYELLSRPDDLPLIRDFEQEFLRIVRNRLKIELSQPKDCVVKVRSRYRGRIPSCIKTLLKGVDEGFRNEAACRIYTFYRRVKGLSKEEATKLLIKWNKKNRPPLPEKELFRVVESMEKGGYEYGCTSLIQFCDGEGCPFYRDWTKEVEDSREFREFRELFCTP